MRWLENKYSCHCSFVTQDQRSDGKIYITLFRAHTVSSYYSRFLTFSRYSRPRVSCFVQLRGAGGQRRGLLGGSNPHNTSTGFPPPSLTFPSAQSQSVMGHLLLIPGNLMIVGCNSCPTVPITQTGNASILNTKYPHITSQACSLTANRTPQINS